ncbi:MAG: hypothetical protein WAO91_01845 [Candidatus Nitrosotenuis sp.]
MGEIGDAINNVFNAAGKTLAALIIGFVLIVVILAFVNVYLENRDTIQRTAAEVCGLEAKLKSIVNEDFFSNFPENTEQQRKAKDSIRKILWAQEVTDEEYQAILDVMDITEKRRLGLEDLEKICYFT